MLKTQTTAITCCTPSSSVDQGESVHEDLAELLARVDAPGIHGIPIRLFIFEVP